MEKRGGKREGAGRPTKLDEEKISNFALNAISKIFGSKEKAFEELAKIAKKDGTIQHYRLLFDYAFGRPVEVKEEAEVRPVIWVEEHIKVAS